MKTTKNPPLDPIGDVPIHPTIAALPKADLHLHQQWSPRLDRVLARREGRPAYDWRSWARRGMEETPPGLARLRRPGEIEPKPPWKFDSAGPFVRLVGGALGEAAAGGAVLVAVRFGG